MKELDFINIIKTQTDNKLIGDDCAYIKELSIVVTQDNFIEDIHFKRDWATPYQIGYKAAAVNISDILASGAEPAYITVGLSLPPDIDNNFIRELYQGISAGSYGAKIAGGDITGSDKIFISITAIGKSTGRNISSRSNAKPGYAVIISGETGTSTAGLEALINGKNKPDLIRAHLEPILDVDFSKGISEQVRAPYAMMDTSDGLADALFKIAEASEVTIDIDFDKIPHKSEVQKENILFGAEDYRLAAAVPEDFLDKINNYTKIGVVNPKRGDIKFTADGIGYTEYDEIKPYNHFGERL